MPPEYIKNSHYSIRRQRTQRGGGAGKRREQTLHRRRKRSCFLSQQWRPNTLHFWLLRQPVGGAGERLESMAGGAGGEARVFLIQQQVLHRSGFTEQICLIPDPVTPSLPFVSLTSGGSGFLLWLISELCHWTVFWAPPYHLCDKFPVLHSLCYKYMTWFLFSWSAQLYKWLVTWYTGPLGFAEH